MGQEMSMDVKRCSQKNYPEGRGWVQVCRSNPAEKGRYIKFILALLQSTSTAVVYECAVTLVSLSQVCLVCLRPSSSRQVWWASLFQQHLRGAFLRWWLASCCNSSFSSPATLLACHSTPESGAEQQSSQHKLMPCNGGLTSSMLLDVPICS